jgi:hypothetical protein
MAGMYFSLRGLFLLTTWTAFLIWLANTPAASVLLIPLVGLWPLVGVATAIFSFADPATKVRNRR